MKKIIFTLLISALCFSCELEEVLPISEGVTTDTILQDPDVTVSDIYHWNNPIDIDTNFIVD